MGVVVLVDWWVSLKSLPPNEAIVALVVNAILGGGGGVTVCW
jgi:hypothetical protein